MRRRATALVAALITGSIAAVAPVSAQRTAPAPASPAAAPDSLGIDQFAALVRRLSDSGGYFDTDNLISNESSYLHPLTTLERLGVRGGAYIGVGPDQNFSVIARVNPSIVFITDIRRDNLLHHLLYKALFEQARNRTEYVARWLGRSVPANIDQLRDQPIDSIVAWTARTPATPASADAAVRDVRTRVMRYGLALSSGELATIERFHRTFIAQGPALRFTSTGRAPRDYYPTLGQLMTERDLTGRQASYLASDRQFQIVKSLERRNLIIPVVGDLSGPNTLPRIGAVLRERAESLSVLYASNVEDYLIRDGRFAAYAAYLGRLPRRANSVIIRSWFGGPGSHPASVPGYYTTQLVQTVASFAADSTVPRVRSYRELVQRTWER
ncbi:hypothetical protein [Gemmatimonas groenlandica]|uniref:DUF7790 domain-containing protein n=1 Tax=Gemmatimonas groenlandica TaxID=2732249 RepID=A0A6M4ILZ4_9BACT|nr:hypothetical protein [Gemmatimonas groenlandica]QJR35713.1 hypothetical protein HKW67_09410 [Gemmatimonas groenlandica]